MYDELPTKVKLGVSVIPAGTVTVVVRNNDVMAYVIVLAAAVAETSFSDRELLNTLKQRIQSGNFKIDYAGLAQSLVEDAVQAIGPRSGKKG